MNKVDLINEAAILLYFTSPECNVCKSLKPKVREMVENKYPLMKITEINVQEFPETAAAFGIFTIQVVLVYFEGKEFLRKVRNMGIFELEQELSRPYSILF